MGGQRPMLQRFSVRAATGVPRTSPPAASRDITVPVSDAQASNPGVNVTDSAMSAIAMFMLAEEKDVMSLEFVRRTVPCSSDRPKESIPQAIRIALVAVGVAAITSAAPA